MSQNLSSAAVVVGALRVSKNKYRHKCLAFNGVSTLHAAKCIILLMSSADFLPPPPYTDYIKYVAYQWVGCANK